MLVYIQAVPRRKLVSDSALLDEVVRFIGERGPSGFSLAELGQQVGLAPATLIQRFGSKQALIERAIGRANEQLLATVSRAPEPENNAEAALVRWLVELSHPFRTRPLIAAHLVFLRRDLLQQELRSKATRHSHLVQRRLCQFLVALGPATARDARSTARALEAHWHGLVIQWAIAGRGSLDAWLRTGLTQFLQALRLGTDRGKSRRSRAEMRG